MNIAQMAACAAALLALSAQGTQAAPALATSNVNLRQGPGTNFPVITTIPGGSTVEISGCSGQWCNVVWQGQTGYSVATSFDQGGPNSPPPGGAPPPGAEGAPPPPGATAGGPVPAGPPGAPPPGYPPPPPGYPPPPPGYYPPPYYPGYGPYPYYGPGYGYYYGPYWRRRYW